MADEGVNNYLNGYSSPDPEISQTIEKAVQDDIEKDIKFGDKPLEAAAGEAASTLTFGLSDEALRKLGVSPERLREVRARSPIAAGIGEVAGIVAPALASGGESLVAKGIAKAGVGLKAAELGAQAVGSGLESLLKDRVRSAAVKNIVKQSATMGTEGALFSMGQLVKEHAQEKADLNAQNIVGAAGAGAMLGAGFGSLFGAVKASVPLVKRGLAPIGKKLEQIVDPVLAAKELVGLTPQRSAEIAIIKPSFEEELPVFLRDKLKLRENPTPEALLARNKTFLAETGTKISGIVDQLDSFTQANPGVMESRVNNYGRLLEKLENIESKYAKAKESFPGELRTLREAKKPLIRGAMSTEPPSLRDLDDLRKLYQEIKYKGGGAQESFKANVAEVLRGELRTIIDGVATKVGEVGDDAAKGLAAQLKDANNDYFTSSILRKSLPKKLTKKQLLTWTDIILAGEVGSLAGGPVGVATAIGRKFLQSDVRRRMAVLADIQNQSLTATKRITEAVEGFVRGTKRPGRQLSLKALANSGFAVDYENGQLAKNKQQAYENILRNVTTLQTDPDMLIDRLAKTTGRVASVAPDVAQETQQTLVRALLYIAEKLPRDPSSGANTVFEKHYRPSSLELAKLERYVQAVENPFSVLEDLEHGTLTREHVDAVKTVYPAVYEHIRQQAIDRIASDGQSMNYNRKVQAGILLDIPTDESLQPYAIRGLQANFEAAASPGTPISSTGTANIESAKRSQTDTQRVAGRK